MKTIMAKNPHDASFSFSRRYFNFPKKKFIEGEDDDERILTSFNSCPQLDELKDEEIQFTSESIKSAPPTKKKQPKVSVSKIKSALSVFGKNRFFHLHSPGLGTKVVGTLFGCRRGHVHFAFQEDPKLNPAFLIEMATPTSVLVREMASGLVRIALECERKPGGKKKQGKLLEEPLWRIYCNGKKCGYAARRECGEEDWKVLKAVGSVTMGAGALPGNGESGSELGELMYMRARFERVVGSKDSEAFYMMNPDGSGGPELSVYLLRV